MNFWETLTEKERIKLRDFVKKHPDYYLEIHPNGIAYNIIVVCKQTKKREDITDINTW